MSLTVTEATAVNRLLDYITQDNSGSRRIISIPDRKQAIEAAETLAASASKKLMAGWRPDEVADQWPTESPPPE